MNNSNSESAKMARQGKSIGKRKCPRKRQLFQKKKMGETSVPAQEIPNKRRKEANKQQSDAASKMKHGRVENVCSAEHTRSAEKKRK